MFRPNVFAIILFRFVLCLKKKSRQRLGIPCAGETPRYNRCIDPLARAEDSGKYPKLHTRLDSIRARGGRGRGGGRPPGSDCHYQFFTAVLGIAESFCVGSRVGFLQVKINYPLISHVLYGCCSIRGFLYNTNYLLHEQIVTCNGIIKLQRELLINKKSYSSF